MATGKQTRAAKQNVRKAQKAARSKRSLAHMPASIKTALGRDESAKAMGHA